MRHLHYEERLQRLITAFKIFKGILDIDPHLLSLPPARRGLREHPFKVPQGASHRQRRGSVFSVRVVKYWNKLPDSVVTAPSVNVFKKRLEEVWTEVFPHFPHSLKTHPPFILPPPKPLLPTCIPTINSYHVYM